MLTFSTEKQRPTKRIEEVRTGAQPRLKICNNVETIHSSKFYFFKCYYFYYSGFLWVITGV